jgi:hypothetical protein
LAESVSGLTPGSQSVLAPHADLALSQSFAEWATLIFNSVLPEISDFARVPLQVFTTIIRTFRCTLSRIFLSQTFIVLAEPPAKRPGEGGGIHGGSGEVISVNL